MQNTRIWIALVAGYGSFTVSSAAFAIAKPPEIDPSHFVAGQVIDNPYFPQPVGTLYVYEGTTEGVPTRDEVCVTSQSRPPIEGVHVTVVRDRAFEDGALVEDTFDWFAQDVSGNVWYLGEDTTEIESGSKEGSWEGGVDGARAGFVMLAAPRKGARYYQEFLRGVAEDQAKILSVHESLCLGTGACYHDVVLTQEKCRLEPGVVEYKYYAPDVGFVRGVIVKGGDESTELVRIGACSE